MVAVGVVLVGSPPGGVVRKCTRAFTLITAA